MKKGLVLLLLFVELNSLCRILGVLLDVRFYGVMLNLEILTIKSCHIGVVLRSSVWIKNSGT